MTLNWKENSANDVAKVPFREVGMALSNQVLPEVWTGQVCHSKQESDKLHRRLGQIMKQKWSLDFVDSYCAHRGQS